MASRAGFARALAAGVLALVFPASGPADPEPSPARPGWVGIKGHTLENAVPEAGGRKFPRAIRIYGAIPGSPAEKGGLRAGDLVVGMEGIDFDGKPDELIGRFRDGIRNMAPGTAVKVTLVRAGDGKAELLTVPLVLAAEPEPVVPGRKIPPDAEIFPVPFPVSPEETLGRSAIREFHLEADARDLFSRLARLHEPGGPARPDPWRLPRFAYAHRNPFSMPAVARKLIQETVEDPGKPLAGGRCPPLAALIGKAAEWLDQPPPELRRPSLAPAGKTVEERIDEIVSILKEAKTHHDKAFRKLTDDDFQFLQAALNALGDEFPKDIACKSDPRLFRLALQVDMKELFAAAQVVSVLVEEAQGAFHDDLDRGMKDPKTRVVRETGFGRIVIAGRGNHFHNEEAAVIVDLGGNDFYTHHAGASAGRQRPFSIVIDYEGDDAYETSFDWTQGCGLLGIGILADFGGNDSYLAQRWAQGACALGVGILYDSNGDDVYRGGDFVQGVSLWGIALTLDGAGNDSYSATGFSQSCALAGGFSLLLDARGDDRYFCKGKYPTGYGEPGLFDAWSQGCGIGFRGAGISGGIALLADLGGNDRYEAGHFSQGGGYYFGWGLLYDRSGDDVYIGSRYAQGFAAHEAIGYFEDAAGNDRYRTRQSVAQGCSWDESVVAFLDGGGDDVYEGTGFSAGASAHNAFCLFIDYSGNDTYAERPARSGPNDYHGGTSLSLFIDAGGGKDAYPAPEYRNDLVLHQDLHGLFLDLPGPVEQSDLKKLIPARGEEGPAKGEVASIACKEDQGQTYACYLPKQYDPRKKWPILFCFSPGGDGSSMVELFKEGAEESGWIVVGSNNARNGPGEPNRIAAEAMWKDACASFNLDGKRCYASGFSGGTGMALRMAAAHPDRFSGVITMAMGSNWDEPPKGVAVYGFCGERDGALSKIKERLEAWKGKGHPVELKTFPGGHEPPPKKLVSEALRWMERPKE